MSVAVSSEVKRDSAYAHQFSLYNQLNFQITLGTPLVLYAKSLGASSTTIGIVAALAPLLTVLQLPTAYFIPRVGYKRFVLLGWFSRTLTVFSLALLPLLTAFDNATKVSLMLMALFIFNVLRGISTGAWLPWLTSLIPEERRGNFLRKDQTYVQIGGLLAMVLSTVVLWNNAKPWHFALLFFLSACAATLSLFFIRLVPEVEVGEQVRTSSQPVPWGAMLKYPPFTRLLIFTVVYNWVIGGLAAFVVGFLQHIGGFSDGMILGCNMFAFVGAAISVQLVSGLMNRTGTKPILRIALVCYFWAVICWLLISSELLTTTPVMVVLIYLILGVAGGLFGIANTRIAMDTMPLMGRNHFFALFTVFTSISLGLAPICWGIFLDGVGHTQFQLGLFHVNRYSLYFLMLTVLVVVTFILANPLVEKKGEPLSLALRDAVIYARLRLFNRLLNR
ncbi:MAG TPA: MFS transporter [Chthoniobacterales bacterium]|jgi:MFS family permease|nr:MFS transporter [Chthoniobacterales bacterium]